MRNRGVDEDRPQSDEPEHRRELHAFGERARDQRRRNDREGHLERHVDGLGNRRRQRIGIADAAIVYVAQYPLQEHAAETADERRPRRERSAVGDDGVDDRNEAGDRETGHHGVADVLLANHAAVEQPKTGYRHHQDDGHRGQHPRGVAAVGRAIRENGGDGRNGRIFVGRVDRRDGGGASGRRRRSRLGGGGRSRSGWSRSGGVRRGARGRSGRGRRGGRWRRRRLLREGRRRRGEADQRGDRQRRRQTG